MRASLLAAVLIGLTVGLVVPTLLGRQNAQGEPPRPPDLGRGAFEYKVVEFGTGVHNTETADDMSKKMNALAGDGWEYVGPVVSATDNDRRFLQGYVAFRRPKK